jgi:hypothetical protein
MIAAAATEAPEENEEATKEPEKDPFGDAVPNESAEISLPAEADASTPPAPQTPRPKWLDEPTGLVNGVYIKNIVVGPYPTRAACDEALPAELNAAVAQFIESYLGPGANYFVQLPSSYVHDQIMKRQFEETFSASFGPMKNLHVQLEFDHKVCMELQRRNHEARSELRMKEVALGAGSVLLLLGIVFSYLKLDTATRGYYTGRLRVATALAILGAGAAAFSMVRHL